MRKLVAFALLLLLTTGPLEALTLSWSSVVMCDYRTIPGMAPYLGWYQVWFSLDSRGLAKIDRVVVYIDRSKAGDDDLLLHEQLHVWLWEIAIHLYNDEVAKGMRAASYDRCLAAGEILNDGFDVAVAHGLDLKAQAYWKTLVLAMYGALR